jgi:hypothetical protein
MGKYHGYSLALHPGEREPDVVAAELQAALPEAFTEFFDNTELVNDVITGENQLVWVDDGMVYYTTGRNFKIQPYDWEELATLLPVPARWGCATWQGEAGAVGEVFVYAWIDGGFKLVDTQGDKEGTRGADAVEFVRDVWNVEPRYNEASYRPSRVRPLPDSPSGISVVKQERTPNPAKIDGFEPVERDAFGSTEEAIEQLSDENPELRRLAAEWLYVTTTEDGISLDLNAKLREALHDPETRLIVGATLRYMPLTKTKLERALDAATATERALAAEICLLRGLTDAPIDALRDALSDEDEEVRFYAARAFERSAIAAESVLFSGKGKPPASAVEDLYDAIDDPAPRVRAAAAVALVRFVCNHDVGEGSIGADAFARAAYDPSPEVREHLMRYLETAYVIDEIIPNLPDRILTPLPVHVIEQAAKTDEEPIELVGELLEYAPKWSAEYLIPILPDLVELGWKQDSDLARDVVIACANEGKEDLVREVLEKNGVDPTSVLK